MRKLAVILLASSSALFFFGCGNVPSPSKNNKPNSEENVQGNTENSQGLEEQPIENTNPQEPADNEQNLKQEKSKEVTDNVDVLFKSMIENAGFAVDTSSWFDWLENSRKAERDKKLTQVRDEFDAQLKGKISYVNDKLKKSCELDELSQINDLINAGVKLLRDYNQKQQLVPENMIAPAMKLYKIEIRKECHEPFLDFFNLSLNTFTEAFKNIK